MKRDTRLPSLSLVLLTLIVTLVGCAPQVEPPPGFDDVVDQKSGIINGQRESGHSAVGALTVTGNSFCTGTVFHDRFVVTAAHCLDAPVMRSYLEQGYLWFALGTDRSNFEYIPFKRFELHPQYTVHPQGHSPMLSNDVAVVELERAPSVTPIDIVESFTSRDTGARLKIVGYGVDNGHAQTGGGIKRSTHGTVARVGGQTIMMPAQESGVCQGDSGGPALISRGGELRVAGIASYASLGCQGFSWHARIDPHLGFLERFVGSSWRSSPSDPAPSDPPPSDPAPSDPPPSDPAPSDPPPRDPPSNGRAPTIDPCAAGDCWNIRPNIYNCEGLSISEDFSTGRYNVHRYTVEAPAGGSFNLRALSEGGTWQPAMVVTDTSHRALFDGEAAFDHPNGDVSWSSAMLSDGPAIVMTINTPMTLQVHVTDRSVVSSGFSSRVNRTARYAVSLNHSCQ